MGTLSEIKENRSEALCSGFAYLSHVGIAHARRLSCSFLYPQWRHTQ